MKVPSAGTGRLADVSCWARGIKSDADSPRYQILRNIFLLQTQTNGLLQMLYYKEAPQNFRQIPEFLFSILISSCQPLVNFLHSSHATDFMSGVDCDSYAIVMLLEKQSERCCDSIVFYFQIMASLKHKQELLPFKQTCWEINTVFIAYKALNKGCPFSDTSKDRLLKKILGKHTYIL